MDCKMRCTMLHVHRTTRKHHVLHNTTHCTTLNYNPILDRSMGHTYYRTTALNCQHEDTCFLCTSKCIPADEMEAEEKALEGEAGPHK